jgi:hypothetical protein
VFEIWWSHRLFLVILFYAWSHNQSHGLHLTRFEFVKEWKGLALNCSLHCSHQWSVTQPSVFCCVYHSVQSHNNPILFDSYIIPYRDIWIEDCWHKLKSQVMILNICILPNSHTRYVRLFFILWCIPYMWLLDNCSTKSCPLRWQCPANRDLCVTSHCMDILCIYRNIFHLLWKYLFTFERLLISTFIILKIWSVEMHKIFNILTL